LADIFDEVEEDLRAERARQFAKRYGGLLALAVLLALAAVAGWQAWRWYQLRQDRAAASVYLTAMQEADAAAGAGPARQAAIDGFAKVAAEGPAGYRTVARLREASLKADAGDRAGAEALWDAVAADRDADRLLRDLASLLWVEHQIDDGDAATLQARLKPLTQPTNPWHGLAQEAQALLDMRQGQDAAAKEQFRSLSRDPTVSEGVRARATGLLARLGG